MSTWSVRTENCPLPRNGCTKAIITCIFKLDVRLFKSCCWWRHEDKARWRHSTSVTALAQSKHSQAVAIQLRYFLPAFMLCSCCTSQLLQAFRAVSYPYTASPPDSTKTLVTILTEDSRMALRSTDTIQLRHQCLQVTHFTTSTKSTGNDQNTDYLYIFC